MLPSMRWYLQLGLAISLAACSPFRSEEKPGSSTIQFEPAAPWAKDVYPDDEFAQKVLTSIVSIIKHHDAHDPFGGGCGPGFEGFGMNRVPMAFYVNPSEIFEPVCAAGGTLLVLRLWT